MGRCVLTLVLVALVAFLTAGPASAADQSVGDPRVDRATQAKKPQPSRLWYRIKVKFNGMVSDPTGTLDHQVPQNDFSLAWEMKSKAVILFRECGSRNTAAGKALRAYLVVADFATRNRPTCAQVKREMKTTPVRRKFLRAAGFRGSVRSFKRKLRDDVGFSANLNGELTEWTQIRQDSLDRPGCKPPSVTSTQRLIGTQPISGALSRSPSGASGSRFGVSLSVTLKLPRATSVVESGVYTCPDDNGTEVTYGPGRNEGGFGGTIFGSEGKIGDRTRDQFLRFPFPARLFGKNVSVTRTASQTYDQARQDAVFAPIPRAGKNYRWTIKLQVCPGGGRKAKRC